MLTFDVTLNSQTFRYFMIYTVYTYMYMHIGLFKSLEAFKNNPLLQTFCRLFSSVYICT